MDFFEFQMKLYEIQMEIFELQMKFFKFQMELFEFHTNSLKLQMKREVKCYELLIEFSNYK